MLPTLIIHIKRCGEGWNAQPEKGAAPGIFAVSKNDVVNKTIELARQMAREAMIVIHGVDGRILEQRRINS